MKFVMNAGLVLLVLGASISIMQIWFAPVALWTFIKIISTLVIIYIVILFVGLAKKEYQDEKKMKEEKFID